MQAVILAAGLGSRIRDRHNLPKGFIQLGEQPIIVESISKLKAHGINNILIVTGYRSDCYESLAKTDSALTTFYNSEYADTSSLYSLYCARDWVTEDFLLLESDLIYDESAITEICNDDHPSAILLSGETKSEDEVYVQANNNLLVNMSKQIDRLDQAEILGEFVGINKLSLQDYRLLIEMLEDNVTLLRSGHYEEDGLVALAKNRPIYCLKISDLLWCEIDNAFQMQKAEGLLQRMKTEQ